MSTEPQRELVPRRQDMLPRLDRQLEQLLTPHTSFGCTPYPHWRSYAAQHAIRDLAVDQAGRLWLATWGGVLSWDSAAGHCTRHNSAHGLAGNATRCISVDRAGAIWAGGHKRGLSTLLPEGTATTAWQSHPDLQDWTVLCLTPRAESGVYAALRNVSGEYALAEITVLGAPLHLLAQEKLETKDVAALLLDARGNLWLGNPWGLHRFYNGVFTSFPLRGERNEHVLALASHWNNGLWVGGRHGLYRFRPSEELDCNQEDGWPRDEVLALAVEPESGVLWVLTSRELGRLYDGVWQPARQSPPGAASTLLVASGIRRGAVAVGGSEGLYQVHLDEIEPALALIAEDALSNAVQTLWVDAESVWVGAARGLFRLDGQTWHSYTKEAPSISDVRAILPGRTAGRLWVGTCRSGLQRLEQSVHVPDAILTQPVMALCCDGKNALCVATLDRLYRRVLGSQEWQEAPLPAAAGIIQVICPQYAAGAGKRRISLVWVGTSRGLFQYRPDLDQWQPGPDCLEQQSIQALAVDPATNCLWIGAAIGLYNESSEHRYRDADVRAMAFAPDGPLWLGLTTGLEAWSPPGAGEVFQREPRRHFTVYDSGLAASRVTALAFRLVTGGVEVWIGSPNGVSCYYEECEHDNDSGH